MRNGTERRTVVRRRNKRTNPAKYIAGLILFLVSVGLVVMLAWRYVPTSARADLKKYYGVPGEGETVVVLGSQVLEERGRIVDGVPYLPLSFVTDRLNPVFYWDGDAHTILYTGPSSTEETPADGQAGGKVWEEGETVYLSLDFVKEHTDLDTAVYQEPDRIILQKDFTDITLAKTMSKGYIRVLGGIKSKVLAQVESGTELLLLDEADGWSHVATWDGYIGYIEKKRLNPARTVTLERSFEDRSFNGDHYSYLQMNAPVNLVWHMISVEDANDYLERDTARMTGVNVISPTWFTVLSNDGTIRDFSSRSYVETAHAQGMQVWGLVDNFYTEFSLFEVLSHTQSRQNLVRNLIQAAAECGMDGINVDFESLPQETIPHYLQFLRELSIETHKNGLVLSTDNPPPENYTRYYRRDVQAKAVDYIIIMGYDEYYQGSEQAGSVASLPWTRQGVIDTIEDAPASRTILGMPLYTRLWQTQGSMLSSKAIGMEEASQTVAAAAGATVYFNTDTMQTYAEWEDGGIWNQIWLEDAQSIGERMKLIREYALGGAASWRLGFETADIWNVISDGLKS